MRTNSDSEKDDALLEAVLGDEDWQTVSTAIKAEALGTFRARQRVRQLTRWAGGVAALVVAIAGVVHWFGHLVPTSRPSAVARREAPKAPVKPGLLTDKELVAAFPKGSCFIAEVDGKKELVFLDTKVERTYMARTGGRQK
jgi:hypothetical protein